MQKKKKENLRRVLKSEKMRRSNMAQIFGECTYFGAAE